MGDGLPNNWDERTDAYLDGELSPEETARFERALADDPALAACVDRAREVESHVRGSFGGGASPSADAVLALAPERRSGGPLVMARLPARRALAYAAVIALLVVGVFIVNRPETVPVDGAALYARFEAEFVPDVVCDTPEKFLDYVKDMFGGGLEANFSPSVALVGWSSLTEVYTGRSATSPRVLLARGADDEEIVTIVAPRGAPPLSVDVRGDVVVFARSIGGFRAYELTKGDRPEVLPLLFAGD